MILFYLWFSTIYLENDLFCSYLEVFGPYIIPIFNFASYSCYCREIIFLTENNQDLFKKLIETDDRIENQILQF